MAFQWNHLLKNVSVQKVSLGPDVWWKKILKACKFFPASIDYQIREIKAIRYHWVYVCTCMCINICICTYMACRAALQQLEDLLACIWDKYCTKNHLTGYPHWNVIFSLLLRGATCNPLSVRKNSSCKVRYKSKIFYKDFIG